MTEKKALSVEQAQEAADRARDAHTEASKALDDAMRELHLAMASESNESADRRAAKANVEREAEKVRREAAGQPR